MSLSATILQPWLFFRTTSFNLCFVIIVQCFFVKRLTVSTSSCESAITWPISCNLLYKGVVHCDSSSLHHLEMHAEVYKCYSLMTHPVACYFKTKWPTTRRNRDSYQSWKLCEINEYRNQITVFLFPSFLT